jgi:hypothetical protein
VSRRRTALSATVVLLLLVVAWRLLDAPSTAADSGAQVLRSAQPSVAASADEVQLPGATDARGAGVSADAHRAAASIPLPDSASITVEPPPGVHFVLPARVELLRPADGWSGVRMLSHGQPGAWTDLPAGSYRLHAEAGWAPQPATLELKPGAAAVVALRPLALVAGRVIGARSLLPVERFRAGLELRRADGDGLTIAPVEFADPDGRFALGGLDLGGEPPVAWVSLAAFIGGSAVEPLLLHPPHDEEWTRLVVHGPEPVVTGVVRIADLPEERAIEARVTLLDGATTWRSLALDESGRVVQPPDAAPLQLGSDVLTDTDGRFILRLADVPRGTVRLLAVAEGSLPLLSPPFGLSPGPEPVTQDLELEPARFLQADIAPVRPQPGGPPTRVHVLSALAEPLGENVGQVPAQVAARLRNLATDGEQPYVFFDTLAAGSYRLTLTLVDTRLLPGADAAEPPVPRSFSRTVQVLSDGPTRVTLDEADAPGGR